MALLSLLRHLWLFKLNIKNMQEVSINLSDLNKEDYDELLIEQKKGVIWIHFAVKPTGNRRRTNFKR